MATTIVTKNGTGAPTDSDLVAGELAVDLTNGRLYTTDLDSGGTVIEIGLNPSGNVDVTGTVTADDAKIGGTIPASPDGVLAVRSDSDAHAISIYEPAGANENWQIGVDADGDLGFYNSGSTTAAVTLDDSNNVGIGTSNPLSILHIGGGSDANVPVTFAPSTGGNAEFRNTSSTGTFTFTTNNGSSEAMRISSGSLLVSDGSATAPSISFGADTNTGFYRVGSDQIGFVTAGTIKAKLDASGNLLVGTTSAFGTTGTTINSAGLVYSSADGDRSGQFDRTTSDGEIIRLTKDGSTVGSIGTDSSVVYMMFYPSTGLRGGSANIVPATADGAVSDNTKDWGSATVRWNDIYATNGTIQTSDEREKQDIEALSDAEQRVAVACKGLLRKWRWKSAVEEKGDDARIHFGIIAQDLQDAFTAEGLDAGRYAMFMSNTWTDEETGEERTRLGVRYHELLAFIIAAI